MEFFMIHNTKYVNGLLNKINTYGSFETFRDATLFLLSNGYEVFYYDKLSEIQGEESIGFLNIVGNEVCISTIAIFNI